MTPTQLKQARLSLGLTQSQMAYMLGYGSQTRVSEAESGSITPHKSITRLMSAYLDGYRPSDWPA